MPVYSLHLGRCAGSCWSSRPHPAPHMFIPDAHRKVFPRPIGAVHPIDHRQARRFFRQFAPSLFQFTSPLCLFCPFPSMPPRRCRLSSHSWAMRTSFQQATTHMLQLIRSLPLVLDAACYYFAMNVWVWMGSVTAHAGCWVRKYP